MHTDAGLRESVAQDRSCEVVVFDQDAGDVVSGCCVHCPRYPQVVLLFHYLWPGNAELPLHTLVHGSPRVGELSYACAVNRTHILGLCVGPLSGLLREGFAPVFWPLVSPQVSPTEQARRWGAGPFSGSLLVWALTFPPFWVGFLFVVPLVVSVPAGVLAVAAVAAELLAGLVFFSLARALPARWDVSAAVTLWTLVALFRSLMTFVFVETVLGGAASGANWSVFWLLQLLMVVFGIAVCWVASALLNSFTAHVRSFRETVSWRTA